MKNLIWLALLFTTLSCMVMEGSDMGIKPQQRQILYPTVKVECKNGGTGSGVAIVVMDGGTLILTAKHVVGKKATCRVRTYPQDITYPATVVSVDPEHDLALLRIETELQYLAKLPEKFVYEPMTPVWKSGAGGGHTPFVTKGLIAENDEDHIMTTTPVVGGDSGGGIFVKCGKQYCLLGIVVAHGLDNFGAVHHLAHAQNMQSVMQFIMTL